jgi:Dienelactone hydrolase family
MTTFNNMLSGHPLSWLSPVILVLFSQVVSDSHARIQLRPSLEPLACTDGLFEKELSDANADEQPTRKLKLLSLPGYDGSWQTIAEYFTPPDQFKGQLGDYRSPLRFDNGQQVTRAEQWPARREEILAYWRERTGKWPPLLTDQRLEVIETIARENFQQLRIRFRWTPNETTTGYLLIPTGDGPKPAVICVYYEPETAIGLGKPHLDFALQLVRRGFVALSIGTAAATENRTYSLYYPSIDDAKVEPLSMLGYAAANAWYVVAARPEVDSTRIGIMGHSFGGKWAMFSSCLFDKFACAAWSDPGIVFDDQRESINYWEPWYLGFHPKPWRNRGLITDNNPARGAYPILRSEGRDLHELHTLMAPRPFLVSGGSEDPLERWIPLNHSISVNALLGQNNRVGMTNRPEHTPNALSNATIYAFFEHFLRANAVGQGH